MPHRIIVVQAVETVIKCTHSSGTVSLIVDILAVVANQPLRHFRANYAKSVVGTTGTMIAPQFGQRSKIRTAFEWSMIYG